MSNIIFELIYEKKFDKAIKTLTDTKYMDVDTNIKDKYNNYMITYAVIYNNLELVKLLIDMGTRLDILDHEGYTILYYIIRFNLMDILEYIIKKNNEFIGLSIIDLLDKHNKLPSYYAIKYNNIESLKLLINNSMNMYIKDINGNNILHNAIYSRNIDIVKLVLSKKIDINTVTHIGETALHIATNLQLTNIIDLLLEQPNINPNIQDIEMDFTPFHYALNLNNKYIITKLLEKKINLNIQDRTGSMSLHYCVSNNNIEVLTQLIKQPNINFNLWDITGSLPIHLIFKKEKNLFEPLLDLLLEHSNLNLQNNDGNSCLHFLCLHKLWSEPRYTAILIKKKLNIFIKNKKNELPIDYITDTKKPEFIKLVADSYLNRLKTENKLWLEDWENICKSNLIDSNLNTLDLEILSKYIVTKKKDTNLNSKNTCLSIITNKINKHLNEIKIQNKSCIKSYPVSQQYKCINIEEGQTLSSCSFTGNIIDILTGVIYITKKYSSVCNLLHSDISVVPELKKHSKYDPFHFTGIEIIWIENKLYFDENFDNMFNKCILNNKKRYIIIPIGILQTKGAHAGYILYDKQNNQVERFEPHGSSAINFNYNDSLLDNLLENKFRSIYIKNRLDISKFKYFKPSDYMEKISLQQLESYEINKQKIHDPSGYCASWSLWFIDMRILFNDLSRERLISKVIKNIRKNNISFKNLIRNYSYNITTLRDELLKKLGTDIDKLLFDTPLEEFNNIITNMINL